MIQLYKRKIILEDAIRLPLHLLIIHHVNSYNVKLFFSAKAYTYISPVVFPPELIAS